MKLPDLFFQLHQKLLMNLNQILQAVSFREEKTGNSTAVVFSDLPG